MAKSIEPADGPSISLAGQRLNIEYRAVGWLKPYEGNPRKNDKAVDRMVASVISHLNDLAVLYKYTGRFDEAERLYRRALAETSGEDAAAATIYHNLGGLNHSRGEFAAAEPDARRACGIRERLSGPDHPETLADACALAGVLDGLGRYAESEPIYRHALTVFALMFGEKHPEVAANLNNLAALRWARGDAVEAESLYLRSLGIKRELLGDAHPDTALTLLNYASMLCDLDRQGEARDMAFGALRVFESALEPSHPRIVATRDLLGRCSYTLVELPEP